MLYVRYVHLTKAKPVHKRQAHPLIREDVAWGVWPQGVSWKKFSLESQGAWRHDELIGRKPAVVKKPWLLLWLWLEIQGQFFYFILNLYVFLNEETHFET
jgi:hypothetical protein